MPLRPCSHSFRRAAHPDTRIIHVKGFLTDEECVFFARPSHARFRQQLCFVSPRPMAARTPMAQDSTCLPPQETAGPCRDNAPELGAHLNRFPTPGANVTRQRRCDHIIQVSKDKMERSSVVDNETTEGKIDSIRTARGSTDSARASAPYRRSRCSGYGLISRSPTLTASRAAHPRSRRALSSHRTWTQSSPPSSTGWRCARWNPRRTQQVVAPCRHSPRVRTQLDSRHTPRSPRCAGAGDAPG